MTRSNDLRGIMLTALSGTLFGLLGFLGTKLIQADFSVMNMLFWRFLIASLWILLFAFLTQRNIFKVHCSSKQLCKTAIFIIISYSANSALYFFASLYIGTGLAMVIFFSFPIFVALFSWVLTDWRLNRYVFISLLAVIVGLALLKGAGTKSLSLTGILLAVTAAISYAVYVYRSEHNTKNMSPAFLTLIVCVGSSTVFFLGALASHTFMLPSSSLMWLDVVFVGVVATALPIQLLLDGLRYISPVKASIISVLEPLVTVMAGVLLLHESISYLQFIGMLIILFGAIIIQFDGQPDQGNILH
jgi:drug/metabolite transporter (DMT)-like permease